jgi:hypothetical protein
MLAVQSVGSPGGRSDGARWMPTTEQAVQRRAAPGQKTGFEEEPSTAALVYFLARDAVHPAA